MYEDLKEGHEDLAESHLGSAVDMSMGNTKAVVEFIAAQSAILEGEGRVRIGIKRYGKTNNRVIFKYVQATSSSFIGGSKERQIFLKFL